MFLQRSLSCHQNLLVTTFHISVRVSEPPSSWKIARMLIKNAGLPYANPYGQPQVRITNVVTLAFHPEEPHNISWLPHAHRAAPNTVLECLRASRKSAFLASSCLSLSMEKEGRKRSKSPLNQLAQTGFKVKSTAYHRTPPPGMLPTWSANQSQIWAKAGVLNGSNFT